MTVRFSTAAQADICLLLEGTFPYVTGGVSSWINQIIRGFPEYRFAILFLGGSRAHYGKVRYVMPANVVHLEVHYLQDQTRRRRRRRGRADSAWMDAVAALHEWFRSPNNASCPAATLEQSLEAILHQTDAGEDWFYRSEEAWNYYVDHYRARCTDPSFIDYFWTIRAIHQPLWLLSLISQSLLPARAYHSVSTGYAGFLGALIKQRSQRPLILSEHGIYTKERKIDLYQSTWIKDNRDGFDKDEAEIGYFKRLWMRFFEGLGRVCYAAADPIISLHELNRQRQIVDGAVPDRTRIIANGIDVNQFLPLRLLRPSTPPPILCLIGRVVPIKDIKTFIRAMRSVANRLRQAQAWIVGPEDEDMDYAQQCRSLVADLELDQHVHFMGVQKIKDILPKIGVLVLSSISEGLPLVILEGFAAGVPVVTTDVGCCRDLIYGRDAADVALGAAGAVVNIADPQGLADAALALLSDSDGWRAAQEAGFKRVQAYYNLPQMLASYRQVYAESLQ